jgi:glycosyltransferase involved in cell wall biosynthesis
VPLVSIIIPSYNCSEYLPAALDSALRQTLPDLEIIVVDDGSTDQTLDVVRPYLNEPRVRYIRQTNQGLPAARNAGVRASAAEYIAFLDADDELAPSALERLEYELTSGGASWCITDIFKVTNGNREIRRTNLPTGDAFYGILDCDFPCRAMFFRRSALVDVGMYDESMRYREDWELNIRMCEGRKQFAYVSEPLYLYTWREGSITTSKKAQMLQYTERILRKHHKRIADQGDGTAAKLYAKNMWLLAREHGRARNYHKSWSCMRESFAYEQDFARLFHPVIHRLARVFN